MLFGYAVLLQRCPRYTYQKANKLTITFQWAAARRGRAGARSMALDMCDVAGLSLTRPNPDNHTPGSTGWKECQQRLL